MRAYTIGLSINEDLKLRKRKGEDKQRRSKLYVIGASRDRNLRQSMAICQCRNSMLIKKWTNEKR